MVLLYFTGLERYIGRKGNQSTFLWRVGQHRFPTRLKENDLKFHNGFVDTVGNTPLIRLNGVSEETGCEILGKAEFLNPGGSVKDRAARFIVLAAEAAGELAPGGTVVEGTAGNTGIGLAHVCNARDYRCISPSIHNNCHSIA